MEIQTKEEIKMAELANYAVETYGANGIAKYNSVCVNLPCAKGKTLAELKTEIDAA